MISPATAAGGAEALPDNAPISRLPRAFFAKCERPSAPAGTPGIAEPLGRAPDRAGAESKSGS